MGHGYAGHGWGTQAEPAVDPPRRTAEENLQGQSHFPGKTVLILTKTLPGRKTLLEPGEASLGWRQCCGTLLQT